MYLAPRARVRAPWPTAPGYMYLLAENKAGYVYPAGWGRGPQKCTCPAPRGYMSVPGFPAPRARAQRRVHACTRRTKNKVANALAILFFSAARGLRVHVPRAPGYTYPARQGTCTPRAQGQGICTPCVPGCTYCSKGQALQLFLAGPEPGCMYVARPGTCAQPRGTASTNDPRGGVHVSGWRWKARAHISC